MKRNLDNYPNVQKWFDLCTVQPGLVDIHAPDTVYKTQIYPALQGKFGVGSFENIHAKQEPEVKNSTEPEFVVEEHAKRPMTAAMIEEKKTLESFASVIYKTSNSSVGSTAHMI